MKTSRKGQRAKVGSNEWTEQHNVNGLCDWERQIDRENDNTLTAYATVTFENVIFILKCKTSEKILTK